MPSVVFVMLVKVMSFTQENPADLHRVVTVP